jgi:CO/xanthine dehydrogenase FAD-binding subunit
MLRHRLPMDLNAVEAVVQPRTRADLPAWRLHDCLLGGGTDVLSGSHPGIRRLVDLGAMEWPPLEASPDGLQIAATCTLAAAAAAEFPPAWTAAGVIAECCRALAGSFKIWNAATVGGNICLALPAAPMLAAAVALDGTALLWPADGGERRVPMTGFTTGPQQTVLRPGEVLRAVEVPAVALRRRAAVRQASLTAMGRSAALLVATLCPGDGGFRLTVTASTVRPYHRHWPAPPGVDALDAWLDALPGDAWLDDVHGAPAWRRHMTRRLAHDLLDSLTA